MSLYFEDFSVGQEFRSRGRTITETDIVNFAGVSGDFVELHTNDEVARASAFGRRIAHGALIFSVSTGLMTQMNLLHDTVIAFYGIDRLRFTAPVFVGDTVYLEKKVTGLQRKPKGGVVTFESRMVNGRGDAVQVYTDLLMFKYRE